MRCEPVHVACTHGKPANFLTILETETRTYLQIWMDTVANLIHNFGMHVPSVH